MNSAHLVLVADTVAAIRYSNQFLAKGAHNELGRRIGAVGLLLNDLGDSLAVGRVKSLVKFVKEVKRSRVATWT